MAGVCATEPSWNMLMLVMVMTTSLVSGNYVENKCYCYSDNYDATLQEEVNGFSNPSEPYKYAGVMPKADNVFESCVCSDVTRVTTVLKVTQANTVTDAQDSSKHADINNKYTTELNDLIPSMKSKTPALENTLLSMQVSYKSNTNNEVLFDVDILLRGRDEALKDSVEQALKAELPSVDGIDITSMTFTVMKCATDPLPALANGQRTWATGNLASAEAKYTCDENYAMSSGNSEEISTCSHTDLTWTALPDGLECTAAPVDTTKCTDDPPPAPPLSSSNWDNYSKDAGITVQYICIDGYSSEDNIRAVSMCKSGAWTTITTSFNCILTGCLQPPPQVVDQGVLTWGRQKAEGTVILYSCNKGYKSNTGTNPEVICSNKTWTGYPDGWACVDENTRLNLGLKPKTDDDAEKEEDELNYLYIVTIPSVAGLVLLIICCLCCTRTDSPLFNICTAKGKLNSGYSAA